MIASRLVFVAGIGLIAGFGLHARPFRALTEPVTSVLPSTTAAIRDE